MARNAFSVRQAGSKRPVGLLVALLATILLPSTVMRAQDGEEQEEEGGISDNSFFVEEAYNQEPGVVQHIFNWVHFWDEDDGRARSREFVFTQEWPVFSQSHQFSYTIPFANIHEAPTGGMVFDENGLGDILLNYRYQLRDGEDDTWAVSPRFSVIVPSGNEERGLGSGEVGYQFNLPMSREFDDFAVHFNAGMTIIPNAHVDLGGGVLSPDHDLVGYNLGASLISIRSKTVQPMLEFVAFWDEEIDDSGAQDQTFELLLSPGVRWAPYTQDSTQLVLGAAAPVGLTRDSPDIGLFLYLSFEHALPWRHGAGCGCDCPCPCE
jgi:hypothetical protein